MTRLVLYSVILVVLQGCAGQDLSGSNALVNYYAEMNRNKTKQVQQQDKSYTCRVMEHGKFSQVDCE